MTLVTKFFEQSALPGEFDLSQNDPNPFKKLTTIKIIAIPNQSYGADNEFLWEGC